MSSSLCLRALCFPDSSPLAQDRAHQAGMAQKHSLQGPHKALRTQPLEVPEGQRVEKGRLRSFQKRGRAQTRKMEQFSPGWTALGTGQCQADVQAGAVWPAGLAMKPEHGQGRQPGHRVEPGPSPHQTCYTETSFGTERGEGNVPIHRGHHAPHCGTPTLRQHNLSAHGTALEPREAEPGAGWSEAPRRHQGKV